MPISPRKKRRFLSSPVTLVIVGILTVYVFFQLLDVYFKKIYTRDLLHESKTYHTTLQQSLQDIEERTALIDDPRGKEAYLREKEGLLFPNEEVYVIVKTPRVETESVVQTQESWLKKIIPLY